MAECIHGFEEGLCDSCYPREVKVDESKPVMKRGKAAAVRGPRTVPAGTTTRPRSRGEGRIAAARPVVPLGSRRIYHVTHISNFESILHDVAIRAGATPMIDLLSPEARAARSTAEVVAGEPVSAFVPFALSPDAAWWNLILTGAIEPTWSDAARKEAATQYIMLVGTVGAIGPDVVVSDRDAASPLARFGVGLNAASALMRSALEDDPELIHPEVLARGDYPLEQIVLLAIPNEPVRERVKQLIRDSGEQAPKLAVYPPWFQPTDPDDEA
ncbi:DarT ssDNA thymidine ADP-ribosyltransferase family protein [Amnibacterium flavum]|uniref:DarT ssDNA thymidine ADP-ribosyltransferase family protein n=1 Tax=Amnibacterium flavum TaxID=2173173 RepID=UPI001057E104|nr:DarT ssDNA thymidine ADP-ribosyltransferase family protein [Amnibacterium flavum]